MPLARSKLACNTLRRVRDRPPCTKSQLYILGGSDRDPADSSDSSLNSGHHRESPALGSKGPDLGSTFFPGVVLCIRRTPDGQGRQLACGSRQRSDDIKACRVKVTLSGARGPPLLALPGW